MTFATILMAYLAGVVIGAAFHQPVIYWIRWAFRPLRCRLHMCGGRISQTEYGMGWQCAECGALKHWESWDRIKVTDSVTSSRRR